MLSSFKSRLRSFYEASPLIYSRTRYGRPEHILRFDGGIGDEFLSSALIRELKRRGAGNIWMLADYPELFRRNPDVTLIARKNRRGVRRFLEVFGFAPIALSYAVHSNGRDIPPSRHVITAVCESLGLSGTITRRPYLYLGQDELSRGRFAVRQIAIQSSGLSAKYAAKTKEWFPDRFQSLVNRYGSHYTFIQVGAATDPLLHGVIDMRGKTTIRETACILQNSMVFVGLAGFLQHLARSVECRSVIIYGGRELPSQTGYSCNENVVNQPPCSPCWIYGTCEHNMKCMHAIGVDEVSEALEVQVSRFGKPLSEDYEECGAQNASVRGLGVSKDA